MRFVWSWMRFEVDPSWSIYLNWMYNVDMPNQKQKTHTIPVPFIHLDKSNVKEMSVAANCGKTVASFQL